MHCFKSSARHSYGTLDNRYHCFFLIFARSAGTLRWACISCVPFVFCSSSRHFLLRPAFPDFFRKQTAVRAYCGPFLHLGWVTRCISFHSFHRWRRISHIILFVHQRTFALAFHRIHGLFLGGKIWARSNTLFLFCDSCIFSFCRHPWGLLHSFCIFSFASHFSNIILRYKSILSWGGHHGDCVLHSIIVTIASHVFTAGHYQDTAPDTLHSTVPMTGDLCGDADLSVIWR